ncbi:MAG: TolC family protein [Chitinophagaceae bacterium]
MKHLLFVLFLAAFFATPVYAQNNWDLKRTIQYALTNNISVRQANLSSLQAELDFRQNRLGLYPNASFNNNWGFSFGRRENPTTGIFENTNSLYSSFGFNTSVSIFNFFSQRNTIAAYQYELEGFKASEEKARNDISLRVANAYLLALQSKEQVNINEAQIKLTQQQLDVTRKRVDAGSLPELNAAEIEAQLARDSSNYITSVANTELQLLQLKAILNLDAGAPFNIETPDVDKIPLESLADLQPEAVYAMALANLPQQRINDFRLRAAEKRREASRGLMYPSIGAFAGLSSNFFGPFQKAIPGSQTGDQPTGLYTKVGSVITPVFSPTFSGRKENKSLKEIWSGFGSQIESNFGQSIGVGISVPLFNGNIARTNWEKAKLNLRNVQFLKEQDNQTLKQEIYSAYQNALASLQKSAASQKAVETAQRSYDLSKKRYDVNLLSTFELITAQNNLFRAQVDMTLARYDYVFKLKVLEFYKGQGLKF